jgi:(aminoalkyl)phosphonate N-acetyltransferase
MTSPSPQLPYPKPLIRRATDQDWPAIHRLTEELEGQPYDAGVFAKVYSRNLTSDLIYYWLADIDGQVVGFISMHVQYLLHHLGPVAEIQELVVTSHLQGGGIGQRLLATARKEARSLDCANLEVTCNQDRHAAHHFYKKNGLLATHFKFVERL